MPFSLGSITKAKEHLVIIGSLSKTYAMTGWRMGYALATEPLVNAFQKLQSQSTSSSNAVTQKAALAAVTGPQDCVQQMRTDYIRLRDRIIQLLAEIPGIVPSLREPIEGCAFAPRCAYAVARCRVETPPLRPIGDAHVVACHEAERVLATAVAA